MALFFVCGLYAWNGEGGGSDFHIRLWATSMLYIRDVGVGYEPITMRTSKRADALDTRLSLVKGQGNIS